MAHKSEEMSAIAEENGWKTQVQTDLSRYEIMGDISDIIWTLYAIRSENNRHETLKVQWHGNLQGETMYKYGDHELRPARKAPVLALIKGKPDPKKYDSKETIRQKQDDVYGYDQIPWDNDDSPAFDILLGVLDKQITWDSPMGQRRSEFCPKDSNLRKAHFRVKTTVAGKRVLEWANATGFQACYVSNIIDVS